MLRPLPCRWFELVTLRDDVPRVLDALARGGAVELQARPQAAPLVIGGVARGLERWRELARTDARHWPPPKRPTTAVFADPAAMLAARLAQLEAWHAEAGPLLAERERLARERASLDDLARLLATGAALPDLGLLGGVDDPLLALARLAVLPAAQVARVDWPPDLLRLVVPAGDEAFVVLAGDAGELRRADELLAAAQARRLEVPAGLGGTPAQAAAQVERLRRAADERDAALGRALDALAAAHDLPAALADVAFVDWLHRHGGEVDAGERLAWISGWTPAADAAALLRLLADAGLNAFAHFPEPPPNAVPPSILANPPWARRFETFVRLLGQPGADEADPSPLVAVIAPLLFGFMFGDVGQGAVLVALGWWARRRVPALGLLVPGGVMAIVFGFLYGSVFAREDLIPALWLHPLHEPVALLAAAVALGAAILLSGLALNALQARWRRRGADWWARDAGLVVAYVGLLAALAWRPALGLAAAGAAWALLGPVLAAGGGGAARLAALGHALAQLVERGVQLLVATVSFARVGAFALAHAGLSLAVVGVAEAVGGVGYAVVLVLGNLLILALEGLVVAIQTTRLLLFEFFVRFLEGRGRVFRPLPPPHAMPMPPPEGRP